MVAEAEAAFIGGKAEQGKKGGKGVVRKRRRWVKFLVCRVIEEINGDCQELVEVGAVGSVVRSVSAPMRWAIDGRVQVRKRVKAVDEAIAVVTKGVGGLGKNILAIGGGTDGLAKESDSIGNDGGQAIEEGRGGLKGGLLGIREEVVVGGGRKGQDFGFWTVDGDAGGRAVVNEVL
jgi:hypothetical protein